MHPVPILITITTPSLDNKETDSIHSCSGISLRINGSVLVITCLAGLLSESDTTLDGYRLQGHFISGSSSLPLRLVRIQHIPSLQRALEHLLRAPSIAMNSWKLGWRPSISPKMVASIAILSVVPQHSRVMQKIRGWENFEDTLPAIGTGVEVHGCPFGSMAPLHFQGWSARGRIANIVSGGNLWLVDVKALPGMEGSQIILTGDTMKLAGMLLVPLRAPKSAAEINIGLPMSIIMRHCFDQEMCMDTCMHSPDTINPISVTASVVGLRTVQGGWATGIAVTQDCVLTVAHLFDSTAASSTVVEVDVLSCGQVLRGRLVYVFMNGMDLAVVRTVQADLVPISMNPEVEIQKGDPIILVAHSIFDPGVLQGPSMTGGHVARVVDERALILCSASIHAGGSGGAVVSSSDGSLIGMATSNAKLKDGSGKPYLISDMSFILPLELFSPLINHLKKDGWEGMQWKLFDVENKRLKTLWALRNPEKFGDVIRAPEPFTQLVDTLSKL